MRLKLVAYNKENPQQKVEKMFENTTKICIGRHRDIDFQINFSTMISNKHCTLSYYNGAFHIYDNKSTNGTFINNRRIAPEHWFKLNSDDEIMLSDTTILEKILFSEDDETTETVTSAPMKNISKNITLLANNYSPNKEPENLQSKIIAKKHSTQFPHLKEFKPILLEMLINTLPKNQDPQKAETLSALKRLLTNEGFDELSEKEKEILSTSLFNDIFNLGPLGQLMNDATINEIIVQGNKQIYIEQDGQLQYSGFDIESDAQLDLIIKAILGPLNRRVDYVQPMVDARLPDGSRVNIVLDHVAVNGTEIIIRKFPKRYTIPELVQKGTLSIEMAAYLKCAIDSRLNIIISGGTSSGKTTLLNALTGFMQKNERLIIIEENQEIKSTLPYVVSLEARRESIQGKGKITVRDLVKNSLRMRPDRLIVGEARGPEVVDMLRAMATGHPGSMATVHADNPVLAVTALETYYEMGFSLKETSTITRIIGQTINIIVQMARFRNGERVITEIDEITYEPEGRKLFLEPIMIYDRTSAQKIAGQKGVFKKIASSSYFTSL